MDEIARRNGAIDSLTLRFAVSCNGEPPLYGKVHWDASDTTPASGLPTPIPADLWDVPSPVAPGRSFAVLDSEAGDPIGAGNDRTVNNADARISMTEVNGALDIQVDEQAPGSAPATWKGTLATVPGAALATGYYASPAPYPTTNPTSSAMKWTRGALGASPSACPLESGWFAVDEITRAAGKLMSATVRFDISCDGEHHLEGKVRWLASDTTTPGPVLPIPPDLWDGRPPQEPSGDYAYIEGAEGDPITNGEDDLFVPTTPGIPSSDDAGSIQSFWGSSSSRFWIVEFEGFDDQGLVGPGYYGDLSSETSSGLFTPGLGIRRVIDNHVVPCPGPQTGWFAVDRVTRIDGDISQLDVRFEQSCDGAPPLHGRIHYDLGGLPSGPPVGALESAASRVGGVDVSGWAIDPDTMSPVSVRLKVDGSTVATVTANGDRPDIGTSHPPYGNAHGFTTTVPVPLGTHLVCAVGVDPSTNDEESLGCRIVTVGAGSPFGSADVVRAVPGGVQVAGWVIDPDTAASTDVHVYVDGKGTALHADGARADVATVYPGYGPAHGFGATIPASPGLHNVCIYGINVGAGANSTLACRTVNVLGGSPIGALDVARQGPQSIAVAGWALDFDTSGSIPVHVYVDGKGTAVTANGCRPDVGSAYGGYGSAHGFSASIPVTPGSAPGVRLRDQHRRRGELGDRLSDDLGVDRFADRHDRRDPRRSGLGQPRRLGPRPRHRRADPCARVCRLEGHGAHRRRQPS